jgi:hypothetical protein
MSNARLGGIVLGSRKPDMLAGWYRAAFAPSTDIVDGVLQLKHGLLIFERREKVADQAAEPGRMIINIEVDGLAELVKHLEKLELELIRPVEQIADRRTRPSVQGLGLGRRKRRGMARLPRACLPGPTTPFERTQRAGPVRHPIRHGRACPNCGSTARARANATSRKHLLTPTQRSERRPRTQSRPARSPAWVASVSVTFQEAEVQLRAPRSHSPPSMGARPDKGHGDNLGTVPIDRHP